MTDQPVEQLTERDREIIRAAKEEIRSDPLPPPRGQFGCLAAVAALLLMVIWPPFARQWPQLEFFSPFVTMGGVVVLLGGIVSSFFGGSSGRARAGAAVEAAARHLAGEEGGEEGGPDRESLVRAATLLLSHYYISQGPTTTTTFDREEMAARIAPSMPLVLAVEEYLVSEGGAWAEVFSLAVDDE